MVLYFLESPCPDDFKKSNTISVGVLGAEQFEKGAHLVRLAPVVEHYNIVHHMNLYLCTAGVVPEYAAFDGSRFEQSKWCRYTKHLETTCRHEIWAYDKGAGAYSLPEGHGFLFGASTGMEAS